MNLPNPTSITSLSVAAVLLFAAGLGVGWKVENWRWKAEDRDKAVEAQSKYAEAVNKAAAVDARINSNLDRLDRKKSIITKEVSNETQRVEYRCVLPESGRVLYLRATQRGSAAASDISEEVPSASRAAEGDPRPSE